jgi:hypothetical protein
MTEEEFKFPWESKIEVTAFIGLISSLAVAFGFAGFSAEQIAALSSFLFILIMIWRKYSNSCIVWVKDQLD